jgi:hypothetical protein
VISIAWIVCDTEAARSERGITERALVSRLGEKFPTEFGTQIDHFRAARR